MSKETTHIPKLPEDPTPYQILDFFRVFQDACDILEWTTGALRFSKIRQHFQGLHKDTWDDALTAIGTSRSLDAFHHARDVFLAQTFEETRDYDIQMDFLRTIKKPSEMQVKPFLQYLRIAIKQVKMIPGAPRTNAGLADSEFSMPCLDNGK